MLKKYRLKYYNFRLVIYLLVLSALGVAVIGSATSSSSFERNQVLGIVLGVIGMITLSLVDYHIWLKLHWLIYLVCISLLVLVLLIGKEVNGATRWIPIVDNGVSIQPSEFAKIFMILFWAWLFGKNPNIVDKWRLIFVSVIVSGIPIGLIMIEPNLSTTILFCILFVVTIYITGIKYRKILIVLGITLPIAIGFIYYIQTPGDKLFLHDYQVNRIMAFINPDEYDDGRYQQDNSVLAIGSGQLYGKGLYNDSPDSVKNGNYLSEAQTDFIFAIVGEELGFVGSCVILGLMALIAFECIVAAIRANDLPGRLIACGIAAIIIFQTFINVGVATELLPNTGIPLPFVSYGLSSLLSLFGGMGVVLNVGLQRKHAF